MEVREKIAKYMSVLINFKICDNSEDCSGIDVCTIGAFYWDKKRKTIAVDNSKCISCGACEKSCPVGAIRVARNEEEYQKIKKEIERDSRKVADLFVDRYGASPISPAFLIPQKKFGIQILRATQLAVVELFNHDSIQCLLRSIPVKELFGKVSPNIKYRKIEQDDNSLLEKYNVKKLPALLFFKDGQMIGKTEGYFEAKDKDVLLRKIKEILSKKS